MFESEVAEMLLVSKACLRRWRMLGHGPRWIKVGKRLVRYRRHDVERWLESSIHGGQFRAA